MADARIGQTFIQLLLGRRQRKQFYRRIRRPMKLFYFLVWSSDDRIKEKKAWPTPIFCG